MTTAFEATRQTFVFIFSPKTHLKNSISKFVSKIGAEHVIKSMMRYVTNELHTAKSTIRQYLANRSRGSVMWEAGGSCLPWGKAALLRGNFPVLSLRVNRYDKVRKPRW